ncbi:hypothetical protein ACFFK0_02810 [Paenibacillus chartarius]|uniref:Uncharacterized protein n=1 Tax=Paenibacillus chartarius TaxID=747481 RepID=A0ABV6DFG0_9BACL
MIWDDAPSDRCNFTGPLDGNYGQQMIIYLPVKNNFGVSKNFRIFIGSTGMEFIPGSDATNGVNRINIYDNTGSNTNNLAISDADGFVTLTQVNTWDQNGTNNLISGTIHANKDLNGKL